MNKSNVEKEVYIPTIEVLRNGTSDKDSYGVLYDGTKIEVIKGETIRTTPFTPLYTRKHVDSLMDFILKNQNDLLSKIPHAINVRSFEVVVEFVTRLGATREIYRFRVQPNGDKD